MKVIAAIKQLRDHIKKIKLDKRTIGFVPTMGALHQGHISLIRKARKETDFVVVSIFVNPAQFGPNEDYLRYPRPFNKDKKICQKEKVDVIFAPTVKEMYPSGDSQYLTYVNIEKLSNILCGKFRRGHFKGVTTVVTKLFNIVQPDVVYFGKKDYQQLKIIEKMVRDLNFPVKIVPCKTVREKDGLAVSSRNVYLNRIERKNANRIYFALDNTRRLILKKKIKMVNDATKYIKKEISAIPNSKIQYIKLCHPETLEELRNNIQLPAQMLVAIWVGKTCLIDNISIW